MEVNIVAITEHVPLDEYTALKSVVCIMLDSSCMQVFIASLLTLTSQKGKNKNASNNRWNSRILDVLKTNADTQTNDGEIMMMEH